MNITSLTARLKELHDRVHGREYVTTAENTLADDLSTLIEIVGAVAAKIERMERHENWGLRA